MCRSAGTQVPVPPIQIQIQILKKILEPNKEAHSLPVHTSSGKYLVMFSKGL